MQRKVSIQDIVDALGMENLIVSINGDTPCNAIMALYTDPAGIETAKREIKGITFNSKEVSEGFLFVCKGMHFKESYLEEAIERGAVCYVREYERPSCDAEDDNSACDTNEFIVRDVSQEFPDITEIRVKDIRKAMPVIAASYYGELQDKLKLIGVTGTKGKSSTVYYIKSILDAYMRDTGGKLTAVCSGIENYDGISSEESHLTTSEIMDTYRHMNNALKNDIEYMTVEVSSQALKYDRVTGINFDAGAFLNIGSDHISPVEHPDFDDYLNSKLILFSQCRKACYSLDSDKQEEIRAASDNCPHVITFSRLDDKANLYAYDIHSKEGGMRFKILGRDMKDYEDFDEDFELNTLGKAGVSNALAAASIAVLLEVPMEYIRKGLESAKVPGRMEVIKSPDGKRIAIVDYAHNKLSFDRFFETASEEFPGKKVICIFGSAGGKAYVRRAELGESAGRNAAYSIITEDDSGEESVDKICEEIANAVSETGGKYEIVPDRKEAIKKAVDMMDENCILFVAGRGRDRGIKRESGYLDYPSDTEIVEEFLGGGIR